MFLKYCLRGKNIKYQTLFILLLFFIENFTQFRLHKKSQLTF